MNTSYPTKIWNNAAEIDFLSTLKGDMFTAVL